METLSVHIAPGLYWHVGDSFRFGVDYPVSLALEVKSDSDLTYNDLGGPSVSFQLKFLKN